MKHILTLLVFILILSISFQSCKEEKKKVAPKETFTEKETIKSDTSTIETNISKQEESSEPEKFFLIRGTFEYKHRADACFDKLVAQGYDPKVFVTEDGFFYRISYMGFSNKKEAFQKLAEERAKEETRNVWLYILPDSYE